MKILIYCLILLYSIPTFANELEAEICILREKDQILSDLDHYLAQVIPQPARAQMFNDKFKHCSVSCLFAKSCGEISSLTIGFLKEVVDLFTPGNAEADDLIADYRGIQISRNVQSKQECYSLCSEIYPLLIPYPGR